MRYLLQSLIISFALIATASTSFAGDNQVDRNPFEEILKQLDDLNDKLDMLHAKDVDLRGTTQNWDKKLDSTNGEANGCNSDRFTCVLDGTAVRDNETGLVWERSPSTTPYEWYLAYLECSSHREVGGRKGWHLPVAEQLASLVDMSGTGVDKYGNPVTLPNGHPFQNVLSGFYWTATTNPRFPQFAVDVVFSNGNVGDGLNKSNNLLHTWCVRGGQSIDGLKAISTP